MDVARKGFDRLSPNGCVGGKEKNKRPLALSLSKGCDRGDEVV